MTLRDELERDAARADHDSIEDGPAFARGVRYALARSESPLPEGLDAALREALPFALAEADDDGSVPDDWAGSEYVDQMAGALAARLRSSADSGTEGT